MKKLLLIALLFSAAQAHATMYTLVSCDYKFIPEYGRSLYVGTYRSQYGNLFSATFSSYCPAVINR